MQVIADFHEAAQPLQLTFHTIGSDTQQQQQQQLAAQQLAPHAAHLAVSPSGAWAAVAGSSHVHIFNLSNMSYHGRLPVLQVRQGL